MENIIVVYLSTVNALALLLTVYDKTAAKRGLWRISEKALFITAALGSSAVMYATMRIIHHKTLHKRFMIGLPVIAVCQIALAVLSFRFFA